MAQALSTPVSNPMADPPRPSSPVSNPAPSPAMADKARQMGDEARCQIRTVTRPLRSATKTAGEVEVLGGSDYALAKALVDLCPWCKKGLRRLINPPFCPYCHRDVLAWNEELQEEWEKQRKGLRASNKSEKKDKELELLRKIREEGVVNRTRTKKATNRE